MLRDHKGLMALAALGTLALACAPNAPMQTGAGTDNLPALSAIRGEDLQRDIAALAGDAMRGREAGTLDELRASGWLVEKIRGIGLQPAGEDGTYYQWWNIRRIRLSDASMVSVAGTTTAMWKDVVVTTPTDVTLDLPMVYVGNATDAELQGLDLTGKAVAASLVAPPNPPGRGLSLASWRYATAAVRAQSTRLLARGASAVVLVADSLAETGMPFYAANAARGTYGLDSSGAATRPRRTPPVLLVRQSMRSAVQGRDVRLKLALTTESFVYPSVNIIGVVKGTNPAKANEYVLYSAHQDHDGVRFPVNGDSIWNGADDNATVSVALMAIARAFVKQPGERPALFVWHGAEERGLLGSRFHAAHPMVPRDQIAAVLNADMIGRNHPDSASLLGVQPPHRNSTDLVRMALRANELTGRFTLDSLWDRPTHPEGWYFRSDHLPYARLNIPAVEYSTNLHPDYHTPADEWQRIDIAKLTRMTQWMYATGWLVANADKRPALDAGFKLER